MGMSPKCDRCGRPVPECEPKCEIDWLRTEVERLTETIRGATDSQCVEDKRRDDELAKLKLQNRALWHVLGELTVQDSQGDWYVSIKEGFRINGLVGDLMESRVTGKRVVRGPILMPEEITKYPVEWIVLSSGDPLKLLGHGKTPEEAIASAGVDRTDPYGWALLWYHDGLTGIRI